MRGRIELSRERRALARLSAIIAGSSIASVADTVVFGPHMVGTSFIRTSRQRGRRRAFRQVPSAQAQPPGGRSTGRL